MKKIVVPFLLLIFWLVISPTEILAQTASLSLDPASGTLNKGCTYPIKVNLDTGGSQTDGTDAILLYDTSRLSTNTSAIIPNTSVYPDFPGNNVDEATGKVSILSLAAVNAPFSGKGTLATINFTVKDNATTGSTQITFDFDPNNKAKTTDSNVVERTTVVDVLNSATSGNYIIGTGNCGSTTPVTELPGTGGPEEATPTTTFIPRKPLPEAGTSQLTSAVAIVGGILTVLGILGLALL